MSRVVLLASIVIAAACGSPSSSTTTPAAPAAAPVSYANVAWKDMNMDQRMAFMKEVVMPKMKPEFVAFDPVEFKDFDCKTCHGRGVEAGDYEMPSPDVHPLPSTPERFMAEMEKDADFKKFTPWMSEKVVPMMAALLGEEPFDPKTEKGEFSCNGCHQLVDENGKVVEHEHDDHDKH